MLHFKCPGCEKSYKFKDEHAGRKFACTECGEECTIPIPKPSAIPVNSSVPAKAFSKPAPTKPNSPKHQLPSQQQNADEPSVPITSAQASLKPKTMLAGFIHGAQEKIAKFKADAETRAKAQAEAAATKVENGEDAIEPEAHEKLTMTSSPPSFFQRLERGVSRASAVWEKQPRESQSPDGRVPCPMCGERVMPTATLCPFCKQAIFSRDKGTNAVVGVAVSIVLFLVLFYALSAFTHHEADKEYKRISGEAERETERLMRDIRRQFPTQ